MTENKGKKFADSEQAEELSLEDLGKVAGGFQGGSGKYSQKNEMYPDVLNNGSLKGWR